MSVISMSPGYKMGYKYRLQESKLHNPDCLFCWFDVITLYPVHTVDDIL